MLLVGGAHRLVGIVEYGQRNHAEEVKAQDDNDRHEEVSLECGKLLFRNDCCHPVLFDHDHL